MIESVFTEYTMQKEPSNQLDEVDTGSWTGNTCTFRYCAKHYSFWGELEQVGTVQRGSLELKSASYKLEIKIKGSGDHRCSCIMEVYYDLLFFFSGTRFWLSTQTYTCINHVYLIWVQWNNCALNKNKLTIWMSKRICFYKLFHFIVKLQVPFVH